MVVLDALLGDVAVVDAVQTADVCVALGLEGLPVKLGLSDAGTLELVSLGMADLVSDVRGMPHNLMTGLELKLGRRVRWWSILSLAHILFDGVSEGYAKLTHQATDQHSRKSRQVYRSPR